MQSQHSIRLLLVDDDQLVIKSLQRYFDTTDDIFVVGSADNGKEALLLIDELEPDAVLTDIHMPEMDGVALLKAVRAREKPPVFIAMTALDADDTMLDVLANGGAAYIVKSSRPAFIIDTVRQATRGGTVVSTQSLTRLIGYLPRDSRHTSAQRPITLTPQETRVLSLLCEGYSNQEIAERTSYSVGTVKKYVAALFNRFEATSRLNLVVKAIRSGFYAE